MTRACSRVASAISPVQCRWSTRRRGPVKVSADTPRRFTVARDEPGNDSGRYTVPGGFRPGRCGHGAVRQVQRFIGEGCRIAVDLDLAKFFDNVRHDILMARVARRISYKRLLGLIGRYLRAGVLVGESIQATVIGTPQGGPLSPLLANILLDDLDKELERRGHRFVRYATRPADPRQEPQGG